MHKHPCCTMETRLRMIIPHKRSVMFTTNLFLAKLISINLMSRSRSPMLSQVPSVCPVGFLTLLDYAIACITPDGRHRTRSLCRSPLGRSSSRFCANRNRLGRGSKSTREREGRSLGRNVLCRRRGVGGRGSVFWRSPFYLAKKFTTRSPIPIIPLILPSPFELLESFSRPSFPEKFHVLTLFFEASETISQIRHDSDSYGNEKLRNEKLPTKEFFFHIIQRNVKKKSWGTIFTISTKSTVLFVEQKCHREVYATDFGQPTSSA